MQISINNFRGVKNVSFELGDVTIIGGDNGAGKTSIAQAISSALTGEPPIPNLKKTDFEHLVKVGAESANVEVSNSDGRAVMVYPDGKGFTSGKPPRTSVYASGITLPLDMKKSDAIECWTALLNAEPTLDDLKTALDNDSHTDEVLQLVKTRGWDGALAAIKETGTRHKGRWEKITNERYGTNKADAWKPKGLVFGKSVSELQNCVQTALDIYHKSLKIIAIEESERKRFEKQASEYDYLTQEKDKLDKIERQESQRVENARQRLFTAEAESNTLKCPHCGKDVSLKNGELVAEQKSNIDIEAVRKEYKDATTSYGSILSTIRDLELSIANSLKASETLKKSTTEKPDASAAENLQKAKDALKAFTDFTEAQSEHAEVTWRIAVANILLPEGLRKQKAEAAIFELNKDLSEISTVAKWGVVAVDNEFSASYDCRPYAILSESEQYRVRATLQAAIAKYDGSEVLIFDRADLLTKNGRNGLFHVCKTSKLKSIILMSATSKEEIPLLKDNNKTLWIAEGALDGYQIPHTGAVS